MKYFISPRNSMPFRFSSSFPLRFRYSSFFRFFSPAMKVTLFLNRLIERSEGHRMPPMLWIWLNERLISRRSCRY